MDRNNFSLYIWGFAMIMIDYYEANNKILYTHDPRKPYFGDTHFGEQNQFPQFIRDVGITEFEVDYYEITHEGAEWLQFFREDTDECFELHDIIEGYYWN